MATRPLLPLSPRFHHPPDPNSQMMNQIPIWKKILSDPVQHNLERRKKESGREEEDHRSFLHTPSRKDDE